MGRTLVRSFNKKLIALSLLAAFNGVATAETQTQVTAQAWLVADDTGNIIDGLNTKDVRSIASITKLMTVMVVLDSNQPLDEVVSTKLYNKKLTRLDLIELALVRSDNIAADLLCKTYITGYSDCIAAMNAKAKELEMADTAFVDSTGLNNNNVSTAEDLLKLVYAASKYPIIVSTSNKNMVSIASNKKKQRPLTFRNTNPIVGTGENFLVSKTGFIRKAGGCIVMMLDTVKGVRAVVLLGSNNTATRIPEARLISLRY